MAYNKIEANGETLIDLTSDTVTADTLVSGRTAHLASGERVSGTFEPVTGVKGNAESTYRKGDVNLTPANIGAATSAQGTKADSAVQTIQIGGTTQTKTDGVVNLPAYPTKSSLGLGNVNNTSDLNKPISTATQAALDNQQEQIDYNTNNGVKNLLKINIPQKTTNGLTFTLQSDGTIVINGTANVTGTTVIYFNLENPSNTTTPTQHSLNKIGYGNFIMSLNSGEEHIAGMNLQILCYDTITSSPAVTTYVGVGESKSITINEDKKYVWFRLAINSSINGKTFDNFVLKPMIRDASIDDGTFEPYAKSNAELTQDLNDISEELDCLLIQAALVNDEVRIQNTGDFTNELYSKYFSYTKPKFAILKLQITSNTYYYKALINSSSVSRGNLMEASFITVNGTYMSIYNFNWSLSGTVGTPTVSYTSLNLGS